MAADTQPQHQRCAGERWRLWSQVAWPCQSWPIASWHVSWPSFARIVSLLRCVRLLATPWTVACQLLCPRGFSREEYWNGLPCPSPGDLPNPGIEPRSPALQVDSLPAEPPGEPKNTGVGGLFLLQGISPTQELNWDLLHCRQILYQLSYEGSTVV